jgi:hypothetical protein
MCAGPSLLPKEEAQVSAQVHSQLPLPTRLTFVLSFPRNTKQSKALNLKNLFYIPRVCHFFLFRLLFT